MPETDVFDPAKFAEELRKSNAALANVGNELAKIDRVAKTAVSSTGGIGMFQGSLAGMALNLLGPVGLVAGLRQMSNALSNVAASSVQMQAFSRNTGLASDNIKDFKLQLQLMGKTSEEAQAMVGSINDKLNNLSTYKEDSDLSKIFFGREGGAAFIRRLESAKDRMGQINEIIETYKKGDERQKRGLADVFTGGDVDAMDRLVRNSGLVSKLFKTNEDDMRRWHAESVIFDNNMSEAWKSISGNIISSLVKISGGADGSADTFAKATAKINEFTTWFLSDTDKVLDKARATFDELKLINESIKAIGRNNEDPAKGKQGARNLFDFFGLGYSPIGEWANLTPYEALTGTRYERMPDEAIAPNSMGAYRPYPQAEDPMGGDYRAKARFSKEYWDRVYRINGYGSQGGTSGATDFSGMRRTQNLEEEQSRTLIDIRDILTRMEGSDKSGSGSGSGGGETYGKGIRSEGGNAQAGTGGFRPSSGMTRADRNNNPGNIEYGEFAKRMGATGSDGRFAVFPDRETGFKAAETLLGGKGYQGLNLSQIGSRWAEGDPKWAQNVSKATGIPLNAVPTAEQRSQIARLGMPRAEGSGFNSPGNSPGGVGGSGDGLPSAVLEEAKKAAHLGPGAVQDYIRSQGYNVNSAWCGDFASAVVRASGGTPPKGASVASNWRNYGQQVDTPQPGDIAVKKSSRYGGRYVPTGQTGSHVNIVESVDGKEFTAIGGNQSRRRASFPVAGYEYFRGSADVEAARKRMDAGAGTVWDGKMSATVDFKNVPPGVATHAETSGSPFEKLQINKSRQNEVAGGSPGQPFAGVW